MSEFEKQGKDEKSSFSWQDHVHIPCRSCSDVSGTEVLKPFRAFPNPDVTTADAFWNSCLKQGQYLNCYKCRRAVWLKMYSKGLQKKAEDPGEHVIYCHQCDTPREKHQFSREDQEAADVGRDQAFICVRCSNAKAARSAEAVDMYPCTGRLCNSERRPRYQFCQKSLTAWKQKDTVEIEAMCARCVMHKDAEAANVEFQFVTCLARKHISAFNPVTIRAWQDGKTSKEIGCASTVGILLAACAVNLWSIPSFIAVGSKKTRC